MDPSIFGNFGGPQGWGGGGAPADNFFGFNPFAQQDSEREHRKQRIAPHLDMIKAGHIPELPETQLQALMRDLKEEGNCVFKEKNYLQAGEHYTCGLIIAKMLQKEEFVEVDRELLSSLFSNRAACCLKMFDNGKCIHEHPVLQDYFRQAVGDCDYAINLNKNNIKAYYRKATALKSSRDHHQALKVAHDGLTSAIRIHKVTEAKDMEDLIKEIRSHIAEPQVKVAASTAPNTATVKTGGATAAASAPDTKNKKNSNIDKSAKSVDQPKKNVAGYQQKSSQAKPPPPKPQKAQHQPTQKPQPVKTASSSVSVSVKDIPSHNKENVDETWLPPSTVKPKKEQPRKKQKKKKQVNPPKPVEVKPVEVKPVVKPPKAEPVKATYQGKYGVMAETSSSEERFSLDEDSDTGAVGEEQTFEGVVRSGRQVESWASEVATPEMSQEELPMPPSQDTQGVNNMGLDDFGYGGYGGYGGSSGLDPFPSLHQDTNLTQPSESETFTASTRANRRAAKKSEPSNTTAAMYTFNKPDNREIGAWQTAGSKPTVQAQKPKREAQKLSGSRAKLTDFPELIPPEELSYPFDSRYSFTLVCGQCYMKVGDGAKGFRANPGLPHDCDQSTLLIRYKDKPDKPQWIKIRPRMNVNFMGKFMLCKNFSTGQPCRVGEMKCTFAHYQEEIHLWLLDRDEHLDLAGFIDTQRDFLRTGQMTKVLNGVVIEEGQILDEGSELTPDIGYDGSSQMSQDSSMGNSLSQSSRVFTNSSYQGSQGLDGSMNSVSSTKTYPPPPASKFAQPNRAAPPQESRAPPPLIATPSYPPPLTSRPPPVQAPQTYTVGGLLGDKPPGYKRGLLGDTPSNYGMSQQQQPQQFQQPPQQQMMQQAASLDFPLNGTHGFKLTCNMCLQLSQVHGFYFAVAVHHDCAQDLLAVKKNGEELWLKIRERKKHRNFDGKYVLCRYYCVIPPKPCMTEEDLCSFAHNRVEQMLWGLEKDEEFNIQEFILQNRSGGTQAHLFTIQELFQRHQGDFAFLCRSCFFGHPPRISQQHKAMGTMCSSGVHMWDTNRHMVFVMLDKQQTLIRPVEPRPFPGKTAYFRLCNKGEFCIRKSTSKCVFAHSMVERDVWLVERDVGLNRDEIVQQFYELKMRQQTMVPNRTFTSQRNDSGRSTPVPPTASASSSSSSTSYMTPSNKPTPQTLPKAAKQPAAATGGQQQVGKGAEKGGKTTCPFQVVEVCGVCWKQGQKCTQDQKRGDRCTGKGMGHTWSIHKKCVLMTKSKQLKEIRSMPSSTNISKGLSFMLCQRIQEKKKCTYGDRCTFAHSMEEMEVWNWMVSHKVKSYNDLAEICRKENEASRQAKVIPKGQSVVSAQPTPPGAYKPPVQPMSYNPLDIFSNAYYCPYCSVQCNSQKQWDEHCASDLHMFNVNSDKEHQWNFRQPPWSVHGGKYLLCDSHQTGKCRYSNVPDMHNLCKFAHSQAELDEWKERWEWRQMKKDIAKKDKVYSYMETILDDYEEAESGVTVLTDEVEGASVSCEQDLNIFRQEKHSKYTWLFKVQSQKTLKKVALLINKDRLHFSMKTNDSDTSSQIAPGECFARSMPDIGLNNIYQISIEFTAGLFGSFTQWVVFDFGSRPALLRKLTVEVGTQFVQEKVKTLREKLAFDRWTGDNRELVRFDKSPIINTLDSQLLKQYKTPSSADAVVTGESVGVELNRHNYVHKMHKLLMIEELSRSQVISSYNLKTEIELSQSIHESSLIIAKPGELFAKVPLMDQLSEDTDAGKLILTSVQKVLIAPQKTTSPRVYEAIIVNKEMFDYDGKGRDYIYLCLSPMCVTELKLDSGGSLTIEVQFQMHRLIFCQMHYAIDRLQNNDIVFPDISKLNPAWEEKHPLRLSSSVLNDDQMHIVRFVLRNHEGYTPPLLIYGPFGTGKTETLAQAAMLLALHKKGSKVLICTHSNSAADLYITKHFDAFITEIAPKKKLVRIYFQARRVNTVHATVQKYSLMSGSSFRPPTYQDIVNSDIVITTLNTSLVLSTLELQGHFTHIFLDEAAQAMECETIMPLSLASENTCVVMAGDHMQIGPKVYSTEAKKQRLNKSLLERIFRYYESCDAYLDKNRPLKLLLKMNYRSKMEILRFISAISYGGPDKLIPKSDLPDVVGLVPLNFYVAQGREVQEEDSTSYYNQAEVEEVVARVEDLYKNWPVTEWGERRPEAIGVVTPYFDQVSRIRAALRKRGSELRSVTVERIMNMQGKEFRAVFISTVRTQFVATSPPQQMRYATECDGDYGEFGFLSDQKLLNTALTRAQSLVAVIGDPVALCAIGDCLNIWRAYLKHCNNMQSIYPPDYNLQVIRSQVVQLIQSPRGPNIALINTMTQVHDDTFLPKEQMRHMPAPAARPEPLPFKFASIVKEEKGPTARLDAGGLSSQVSSTSAWASSSQASSVSVYSKPDENYLSLEEVTSASLDTDDLLKQLCFDAVKKRTAGCLKPSDIDFRWLEVEEEGGHAVIKYDEAGEADDGDDDSDLNNSFGDDLGGLLVNKKSSTVEYSPQQLRDLMLSNPFRYKHCQLHLDRENQRMYAKTLDPGAKVDEIVISTRQRCGRGLHGDEVVVEILHEQRRGPEVMARGTQYQPQGCVLGVLQREADPLSRVYVCTVRTNNTGILYPLNQGMLPVYNLQTKARAQRAKKGFVSVYALTKTRQLVFSHHELVDSATSNKDKLFAVLILKWDSVFHAPLGLVMAILPRGTDKVSGLRLLKTEYAVPPASFSAEALRELNLEYPEGYSLPETTIRKRLDFREKTVFTIGEDREKSLNSGFSLDMIQGGQLLLGIHIADVSHFLKREALVNAEISSRAVDFRLYEEDVNTEKVLPAVPEKLSRDICSLLPMKQRLALSLFFQIDSSATLLKMTPKKSVVQSRCHLSLDQVQDMVKLRPSAGNVQYSTELQVAIVGLHRIAKDWRRNRLGSDCLHPSPAENPSHFEAEMLVEEVQLFAAQHVAGLLERNQAFCSPLLAQSLPSHSYMQAWRGRNAPQAKSHVGLARHFLPPGQVCNCEGVCSCIQVADFPGNRSLMMSMYEWNTLRDAIIHGNTEGIASAVMDVHSKPQVLIGWHQLEVVLRREQFVSSSEARDKGHHTHNVNSLVAITSPLSSYVDIVLHKIFLAASKGQACPYSPQDISAICAKANDARRRAKSACMKSQSLQLALSVQHSPIVLYPLIHSTTSSSSSSQSSGQSLQLLYPCPTPLRDTLPQELKISLISTPDTKIVDSASINHDGGGIETQLKISITNLGSQPASLETWPKFVSVPTDKWIPLLQAVKEGDKGATIQAAVHANEVITDLPYQGSSVIQINPDTVGVNLKSGNVAKVQVYAEVKEGILQPSIQLFHPAPALEMCVEHKFDPLKCFIREIPSESTQITTTYPDIAAYKNKWLPLIQLESTELIMAQTKPVVINNVVIRWQKVATENELIYQGSFKLPLALCLKQKFTFALDQNKLNMLSMYPDYSNFFNSSDEESSFVCVRHPLVSSSKPLPEGLMGKCTAGDELKGPKYTWVGHCGVVNTVVQFGEVEIWLKLLQSSVPLPSQLLEQPQSANVEVLEKTQNIRIYQTALKAMANACDLCQYIILGLPTLNLDATYLTLLEVAEKATLPGQQVQLDGMQGEALHKALSRAFCVVQGVAGSGKTLILARQAYIFTRINAMIYEASIKVKGQCAKPVVLICAPTDQCLDIIEMYLKQYGQLHIARPEFSSFVDPSQYKDADIIMCTTIKALEMRKLGDKYLHIQQILVDQAHMLSEPEMAVPLAYYTPYQVTLYGDPRQEKPHVRSEQAGRLGLSGSLLSRYTDQALKLTRHYRMHQAISEFPAQSLYKNVLQVGREEQKKASMLKLWPENRDKPIAFVQVEGQAENQESGGMEDTFNTEEVAQAVKIAANLVRRYHAKPQEVAVLSFYPLHSNKIREGLVAKGETQISVSTVTHSQGREWDYVILSCVSSLPSSHIEEHPDSDWIQRHLGRAANTGQMCLALTRAKKGLIIIGNVITRTAIFA